jgi:hypothetical protein
MNKRDWPKKLRKKSLEAGETKGSGSLQGNDQLIITIVDTVNQRLIDRSIFIFLMIFINGKGS